MKILLASILSFVALLLPAVPVLAADDVFNQACDAAGADATLCADNDQGQSVGNNSLFGGNGILTKVARFIAIIAGIAGIVLIMIGGFKYITASGDPTNINSAKNTILYALVGMVIAAITQSIVSYVLINL